MLDENDVMMRVDLRIKKTNRNQSHYKEVSCKLTFFFSQQSYNNILYEM